MILNLHIQKNNVFLLPPPRYCIGRHQVTLLLCWDLKGICGERAEGGVWVEEVTCAEPRVGEGRAAVFEHLLGSLGGCCTGQGRDKGRCAPREG